MTFVAYDACHLLCRLSLIGFAAVYIHTCITDVVCIQIHTGGMYIIFAKRQRITIFDPPGGGIAK